MKKLIAFGAVALALPLTTTAQQVASSNGYRVCSPAATQQGLEVVRDQCGAITAPNFSASPISSERELMTLEAQREAFRSEVKNYGQCITQLINSYRRPGAPADSLVPDQAACAHSWAQDQATEVVRAYGKACIDYSNRSMMDASLTPYDGSCYPTSGSRTG
ncbi:MAG: hypothetical protein AAGF20_12255 [Pseudomonadota bacterium]